MRENGSLLLCSQLRVVAKTQLFHHNTVRQSTKVGANDIISKVQRNRAQRFFKPIKEQRKTRY